MSKKFTSFLVLAAALLLTVPTHAQIFKKAAKQQVTTLKAGPLKVNDVQKVKAAKAKANDKTVGFAFTGAMLQKVAEATLLKDAVNNIQEDKAVFEKQMEKNFRAVQQGKAASVLNKGVASAKAFVSPRTVTFDAAKPSARRAGNRAEVVDANGIITSPAEGESKLYDRAGFSYYVSNQQLYYQEQAGKAEIVETTDGVVYIKDFLFTVGSGAWVKGTKEGNTITIPAGQIVFYNTNYNYGLYIAKCAYVDGTGWTEVAGDITLTVDGNTISLDDTDEDHPVAAFWTDDNTFSGYGDYETVFSYDPDYVAPQPIELPDGATVETWYQSQTIVGTSGDDDGFAKVAFVGNDVYLSGIFKNFPNSWIKGTIDGTTVTFSGLQFLGGYGSYEIYATGSTDLVGASSAELQDFKMTYDAAAKTLTSVNTLLANAKKDAVFYLEAYKDIVISKEAPAEPEATTGDPVDALPYTNTLSTADLFGEFGVIDSNKDGSTWAFDASYGAYYLWNSANNGDDWLISPAIKLEAGKKYHFAIDAKAAGSGFPERFEVLIGTEPKASALTQSVLAATEVAVTEYTTYENEAVEVAETGYYHFGIHAISDADQYRLMIANFLVEAGAEPTAPAAVTDFALAQAKGKLETIVSFKAPAKNVGGDDLTDLTKIDVLRDGAVIKSIVNVPEGAVAWTASEQDYENAQDVASIDFGSGLTATMTSGGNSNTPKYYTSGTALRMYAKNSMTLKGTAIKKVVFTFKDKNVLEANVGTLAIDGMTGTWTGNADEIVFTVTDGSGNQARIQKIEIETGLTLTPGDEYSYVDNAEDLTAGTHVYQVIPYNATGAGVKSEEKSIFLTVAYDVPHTFDLSQNLLDWFQVIDNNADGKTWVWSETNGAYYPYSSTKAADDYLISMPVKVKSGKKYNVIVNARGSDIYPERMEVKVGTAPTVEGLNLTAIEAREIADGVFTDYEGQFTAAEDGEYFIGIHAISDADMMNLCVMSITVELAPEETAPAAVADFAVAAGAEGALEANLAFTAPAKAINDEALTANVDVKIYRDGEVINTLTGVAPGAATTWKDETVEGGAHTYYVVPANESGDGLKSEKVSVFVGIDEVGEVENITVTGTTASTISFSWDPVTGANGGYVNTAAAKYAIVSTHVETYLFWQYLVVDEVLGTVTGQTSATVDYDVNAGEQEYKYFGVLAYKDDAELPAVGDEYDGGSVAALVGAPYELPMFESFTGSQLHYLWDTNATLFVNTDSSDDDGVALDLLTDEAGLVYLQSGKIKINDTANPTLILNAKSPNVGQLYVYASKDGGEFTPVAALNLTEDYQNFKVSLEDFIASGYVQFTLAAVLNTPYTADASGNLVDKGDYVTIDEIRVVDLYEYDLSINVKAPASVKAGQTAAITAIVKNEGENAATDYTVTIKAGEKVLTTVIGDEALAPFASDEITVDLETSVFDEAGDLTITAEVAYENDLNEDNNSATAILTVQEPAAVAPTSLLAEDKGKAGVDLTWTVNEGGVAEVTESFDDESVFEPFGLGGITADVHTGEFGDWTVYDGNGIGTYGFNGTDFPNAYQPMGFLVFNPSQVSEAMTENYAPHSGDQFMISFCPVEENNAPAADHWMISPELPGIAQTVGFYARVITNQYGPETFEVWASSTDNNVNSFTKVADFSTDAVEWTEFTAELPAGTKFFAIRHTSTDVFGLMIDDVKFSANTAATAASFNIYYNGEKIATVEGDKTTYTVAREKVEVGTQTFGVSAVYANGAESRVTVATIEIVTGIQQIAADGKAVDVYSLDGKLIRSQATSLDGLKGFYIVNGKKVMVK